MIERSGWIIGKNSFNLSILECKDSRRPVQRHDAIHVLIYPSWKSSRHLYKRKSLRPCGLGDFFTARDLSNFEQTSFIEDGKDAAEIFTQFQAISGAGDRTDIQELFDSSLIIRGNVLKFFVILHIGFLLFG